MVNEAILYILYNKDFHAIKIGISDITGNRYKSHKYKGWEIVAYWHFFERDKAKQIESSVLTYLRDKHGYYLNKEDMPQSGYTETFNASKISKKQVIRLVNSLIRKSRKSNS